MFGLVRNIFDGAFSGNLKRLCGLPPQLYRSHKSYRSYQVAIGLSARVAATFYPFFVNFAAKLELETQPEAYLSGQFLLSRIKW